MGVLSIMVGAMAAGLCARQLVSLQPQPGSRDRGERWLSYGFVLLIQSAGHMQGWPSLLH